MGFVYLSDDKIKTFDEIRVELDRIRTQNPKVKVVTTNGAFDIIHSGHIKSLEVASFHGDILIIGLNSDSSIRSYKSKDRPIIGEEDRAKMLSAFHFVDYVVIFNENDPREFLKVIRPDFHVKSRSGYKGIEGPIVEDCGGKIVLTDDIPGISTSQIINKIIETER